MSHKPETKICAKCKLSKPLTDFAPRKNRGGKPYSYCRSCMASMSKEGWIKKRAEKRKEHPEPQPKPPMSPEQRENISKKMKAWYAAHPDSHPWKNKKRDRFFSAPCEKLKEYLRSKAIEFVEEFSPNVEGRHFSLDIAFPEKKIAIEVNGTQHYNKDGTLKPYYQERHDILERNGWTVYELFYGVCYKLDKIQNMIPDILSAERKCEFDYANFVPKKEKVKKKLATIAKVTDEGQPITEKKKGPIDRIVIRKNGLTVHKADLAADILSKPMTAIAARFGVSSTAVKGWCRKMEIVLPDMRGFWAKRARKAVFCKCGREVEVRKRRSCSFCLKHPKPMPEVSGEKVLEIFRRVGGERGLAAELGTSRSWARKLLSIARASEVTARA